MVNNSFNKRIIDYDPLKCENKEGKVLLFSPLDFIEGSNLYLPERVRMPNGKVIENVVMDISSFKKALLEWNKGPITLYAGKNYILPIFNYKLDSIRNYYWHLQLPNVNNICLYDEICKITPPESNECLTFTTKNGILYCDGDIAFVPDNNPYAENLPLEPLHGNYEDSLSGCKFNLEGCGKDLYGGIYSLDGKSFIRWDGNREIHSYKIRSGVEIICDKAFWIVTAIGNGDHGLPLSKIHLPDSLKIIGKEAFRASLIRNVILPSGTCEIDDEAFLNCQALRRIHLPNGILRLGKHAFAGSAIKSIFLPKSIISIGDGCFDHCFMLSSIQVENGNNYYSSEQGVLFNLNKTSLILKSATKFQ